MRGASQTRYTWYLAHTPKTTPTKVPTEPLKPPSSSSSCEPASWQEWRMLLLTVLAALPPHWVYVMCMFSALPSLSFCKVYAGSALSSEPHICVNCAFTFEVVDHASLRPLRPSPSPLHRFDSLSCYGELADPQIMPLALFWAVKKKKKKKISLHGSGAE